MAHRSDSFREALSVRASAWSHLDPSTMQTITVPGCRASTTSAPLQALRIVNGRPSVGVSLAQNLRDLQRHADDVDRRVGFTHTVLGDGDRVIGCVHTYPARSDSRIAQVQSWVRASWAELDLVLHDAVAN